MQDHFVPLNLPPASLKLIKKNDEVYVFCQLRKKLILCSPEEWVRQHCIAYLCALNYPKSKLNSEVILKINGQNRRADIVFYSSIASIELIVECKAPQIKIDDKTFLQVSNYIQKTNARYFWLTNGLSHFVYDCFLQKQLDGLPRLV